MTLAATHNRVRAGRVKRALRAGDELAFSPVHLSGDRVLSHTIRFARGRYHVADAEGRAVGSFATLARADHEGHSATAEAHALDREDHG